ncbi:MAG TPA: insulinase family protein [Aliiroseovarius sp.]|nr:insulinase family protein [Aliiroseovarius sp.]
MKRLALVAVALVLSALAGLPARAEIAIQEVTSPGGITAWLVEEHSIPFTALEIRFRGGASLDAPGKRGAINLMTGLLEEGAGDMDARAFAEATESLAASYRFDVGDDSLRVSARFLSENRDQAVELLRLAITEPRFDPDAIERVRGQVLSHLRSRATDPDSIAGDTFDALAFPNHPYGSYLGGTIDSVTALTRADIVDAFARTIARDRIYVSAVGDITPEALGVLLDRLLGGLPEAGAPEPPDARFALEPGLSVVAFENPQSVVQFGHEGILRDDPDYIPAYILNTILGAGNFNARLMDELREKRGLTYSVRSYLLPKFHGAVIAGQFSSSNDRVAEAIAIVREEWRRIATQGVTQAELDAAKTYLTGAYPLRFDGNAPIARILVGMQMIGLPRDYVRTRNDQVNAVTLDEINRVAARIYKPDALHFVVVGQPEGLDAGQ